MQINKRWLDCWIKELHANACVLNKVAEFKDQIESALARKLSSSKWTLIEFFVLSLATHIGNELLTGYLYQFKLNDMDCCQRKLNQSDVKIICQKYNQYYYDKLILLVQLSQSKGMVAARPAIEWLELIISAKKELYIFKEIISYKITNGTSPILEIEIIPAGMVELAIPDIAQLIRYQQYNLDPVIARKGVFPVQQCDIAEAAALLNISRNNLITKCFQSDFGAYVKLGPFEISSNITSSVDQAIIDEVLDQDYLYHYQGLGRILKVPTQFSDVETSLKAFYQDSDIYASRRFGYTLVRLQPSLSEAIQGINKFIVLKKGQNIRVEDLIFITDELNKSKLKDKKVFTEESQQGGSPIDEQKKIDQESELKFERQGHFFNISFFNEHTQLRSIYGLIYISYLLDNPNKDISVLELYRTVHKPPPDAITIEDFKEIYEETVSDDGYFDEPIMTEEDKKRCEARRDVIDAKLLKISVHNSPTALSLLSERKELDDFLNASTNKSGKIRKVVTELEKIRQNVSKAIHTAFDCIEKEMPQFSKYLRAFIRTKSSFWQYHLRDIP